MDEKLIKLLIVMRDDVIFGKHRRTRRNYFLDNDAIVPQSLIGKEVTCSVMEEKESVPFEKDFTTQYAVKVKRNGKTEQVKANEKILTGDIVVYNTPKRTFTLALSFEEERQLAEIELLEARKQAVSKMAACTTSKDPNGMPF